MGLSNYAVVLIYLMFIVLGFASPFVMGLGYLWVDVFYPQRMSSLLAGMPVAFVIGALTLAVYALLDLRSPPRPTLSIILTLAMALWVTLTTTWAVAPEPAWEKWDWAFKTVAFSALVPFFIRSRIQIEAFIQVFLFACALHIFPFGGKALLGGGGYAKTFGYLGENVGLEEGSELSAVSIMFIPIILHLRRHSLILSNARARLLIYGGYIIAAAAAPIATVARTAIIGYGVLAVFFWLQSRRKVLVAVVICLGAAGLVLATSNAWKERISTIETYDSESSAETRIGVWKWTLEFVASRPQGGGFMAFVTDHFQLDNGREVWGHAFHSIYFEVLGEHGWLGLSIFLALIVTTLMSLRRVMRRTRDSPELAWCEDLARALFCAVMVILACGSFIGIAFQPILWYLFALATCLSEYARRALAPVAPTRRFGVGIPKQMPVSARLAR